MVSTTAGLHRNNTGWQLLNEFDQCLSPHRSTDNHSAAVIYTNNAAAVFPMSIPNMEICMARFLSLQEKDIIFDVLGRAGQPIINSIERP